MQMHLYMCVCINYIVPMFIHHSLFSTGFSNLQLNEQMRLLQGSWCEILTLIIIYRSLEASSKANLKSLTNSTAVVNKTQRKINETSDDRLFQNLNIKMTDSKQFSIDNVLSFTAHFAISSTIAKECNLYKFYQVVSKHCNLVFIS